MVAKEDWPARRGELREPAVLDLRAIDAAKLKPGTSDAATGEASFVYVNAAIDAAIIWGSSRISQDAVVRRAIIGRNCHIGRSAVIGDGVVLGDKSVVTDYSRLQLPQ